MNEINNLLTVLINNYKKNKPENALMHIPVGISGRHVHLKKEDLEALFGKDYVLTPIKNLSQPGQYATKEQVILSGPKGIIERVRIIGPIRSYSQVEILRSDAFKLGVKAVTRLSSDIKGTPGLTLIGPKGAVVLDEGVIVAKRHIHLNLQQARQRNLKDKDVVSIKFGGDRSGILNDVIVRANDSGYLDCHIDQEEANALGIGVNETVEIIA